MAKRKTAKVKNLVENPTSITEDELKDIQQLVQALNNGHMNVGKISSQKHELLHQVTMLEDRMKVMQEELKEKYGEVNINIQDGSINKQEDVKADS